MFSLSKELSNLYGHNITHGTLENVLKRYNDAINLPRATSQSSPKQTIQ